MTKEDITRKVSTILTEQLGTDPAKITPESFIGRDLGADSLDNVEIVMALEEEFGIDIPDDDVEKLCEAHNDTQVQDLIDYLAALPNVQAA